MTMPIEKIIESNFHPSMRGYFAGHLYNAMIDDPNIRVITADLGFGLFDKIKQDFPDRFLNVGAAEQAMIGIGCGMALSGLKPFCFSITPFLIKRPFETVSLYVNYSKIPVRLVGGGRDKDYTHDGISHNASDIRPLLDQFINIEQYWPYDKKEIEDMVKTMVAKDKPAFISLKR